MSHRARECFHIDAHNSHARCNQAIISFCELQCCKQTYYSTDRASAQPTCLPTAMELKAAGLAWEEWREVKNRLGAFLHKEGPMCCLVQGLEKRLRLFCPLQSCRGIGLWPAPTARGLMADLSSRL